MKPDIKTIELGPSASNCYLIKTQIGFILIVTGKKLNSKKLEDELCKHACMRNNLNLIIFMHGNSCNHNELIHLREKYKVKIAMHILDRELLNDSKPKHFLTIFSRKKRVFKPDLIIDEGYNLSIFGLNARVLYLAGYSDTIGILTENGELFCDDLITSSNNQKEKTNEKTYYLSKLKNYLVDIIYPAHGNPFSLQSINS